MIKVEGASPSAVLEVNGFPRVSVVMPLGVLNNPEEELWGE